MDLPNPKDLKALLKVCREFGVDNVEFGAIKVKFGEMPRDPGTEEKTELGVVSNLPSQEDLAFWSAQPDPLLERQAQ